MSVSTEGYQDRLKPLSEDEKTPRWQVTLAVIIFCGVFWVAVGYVASYFLGQVQF